jgi:exonuclease VII small subunit
MLPDYSKLIASPRLQVQPALLNELKGYLAVGPIPVIDWNDQDTIRRGQEILAEMEAKLDRVMAIHHDAKRILQRISSVITTVKAELVNTQVLTAKMSGPQTVTVLETQVPEIYELLRRWELVAELCHDAQKRLDTAKDTIKLMAKLDDNLRWASNRNP